MKLNNSQRDAFVRSVMHDVPKEDYNAQLKKAMQDFLYYSAPKEVQAVYDNPDTRKYLMPGSFSLYRTDAGFSDLYLVPNGDGERWGRPQWTLDINKMPDSPAIQVLRTLVQQRKEQAERLEMLEVKLRQTIYSVTTLKQALEILPEFAKYLPQEPEKTAKNMLPAVANLVSDLMAAGWPKDKAEAKAAAAAK